MGRKVDVDELIDTQDVARILGLAHRNTVSEYQARYDDMPRPVINLGRGRSKLWIRQEVERWRAQQVAGGRTRAKRSPAR
jgi:glutathione-regulated potassium-efflux system ancillary protein KefG